MQITKGNGFICIAADKNVTNYATSEYQSTDMTGYNIAQPSVRELRSLYQAAQRIYWSMKDKRHTLEECEAARTEYANKYLRYKTALLAQYEQ